MNLLIRAQRVCLSSVPLVLGSVLLPALLPACAQAWRPARWSSSHLSGTPMRENLQPGIFGAFPAAAPLRGVSRAETPVEPYPTNVYRAPWSRLSIGADVSPLGVGIKGAIVLNTYLDGRLMGNFFNYTNGRFETEGFNVYARLHLASAAAALDFYPFHSIWRLSVGTMFLNGNQISARLVTAPGTSIDLNGQTFYSPNSNPATGITPLNGTVRLGLNRIRPALTLSGGFGNFIAKANHHWTFPSEFGVILTGAPTLDVNMAGWVCLDKQQTQCSNLGNPANPVTVEFNNALNTRLDKIRRSLDQVHIYPIFSYSVVYSFDTPW